MPPGAPMFLGMGRERLMDIFGIGFGTELLYSFIIIICSLMIYFGTKELYELSANKGIKYFRYAFLFFAIAYFFRSFIKFIVLYFNIKIIEFSPVVFRATGLITQFAFMYFSSMSLFYLLYSVMWKRWNGNSYMIYLLHGIALLIAIVSVFFRDLAVYLGLNLFLLIVVVLIAYISHRQRDDKSRGSNLYVIYILLSLFWIFNITDAIIPDFFAGFQLFIYLASIGIFLSILYKVLRRIGN
jgi:hypothetical protein